MEDNFITDGEFFKCKTHGVVGNTGYCPKCPRAAITEDNWEAQYKERFSSIPFPWKEAVLYFIRELVKNMNEYRAHQDGD